MEELTSTLGFILFILLMWAIVDGPDKVAVELNTAYHDLIK